MRRCDPPPTPAASALCPVALLLASAAVTLEVSRVGSDGLLLC